MKVKAPKSGKKILLERITPLWRRLSFNQKVTLRNLFRYKQRMFMTVFGIAGCMAMLVTGFALKSSSDNIVTRQFGDIYKYQGIVVFDTDSTKEDKEYKNTLNNIKGYEGRLDIHQESVTFKKENMNKQSATLYVPKSNKDLSDYIVLQDRKTKEKYTLSDDGVIITEKLSKLLQVSKGDSITLSDDDNNSYSLKVSDVAESYLGHSVYMSSNYYKKVFNKNVDYNANLLKLSDNINEDEVSTKLMNCKKVINVTFTSTIKKSSEDSTSNLGLVMLVIIIASGGLAFIVLYNLTNINVSERIRELSTIKVLGFYDNEVTMYIVRENIILTLLGILTGSSMGYLLYSFIIKTAETDIMMMIPDIYMDSYIYSGLMTFLFSAIVMIIMHKKLKNVNMIDALKSNE
jgi:putative ABC transport system permease protein